MEEELHPDFVLPFSCGTCETLLSNVKTGSGLVQKDDRKTKLFIYTRHTETSLLPEASTVMRKQKMKDIL